jgi:DNA topoisomerase-2
MLTRLIFRPEDDVLLEHVEDDGEQVEPRFYIPIIPMILVNGNIGIGTGWSSSVPCYNPLDLIECIKLWLENDGKVVTQDGETTISLFPEIKPWYRQHTGEMVLDSDQKYTSWGKLERDKNKVRVTELPVGLWTDDFKDFLEELREEKQITNYKNNSTVNTIDFTITEATDGVVCDETNLKLYKYIRTSNMVLFSESGQLKKYSSVDDIINEFCQVRFAFYIKRKKHILNNIENEIKFLGNKKRFLEEVRDGEIKLFEQGKQTRQSRKTADLVAELEKRGYDKMVEEKEDAEENEDELKKPTESKKHGYDYLLRLQIHSFTAEKIDKLKNDIANRVDERDKLKGTSEKQLWLADLEVFEKEYKKYLDVLVKESAESAKVKNKKITK